MKGKTYPILSLFIFMLVISSPLIAMLVSDKPQNFTENRKSAAMPAWPENYHEIVTFKSQLEHYLKDNFGLRNKYIKFANRVNFQLFKETTSKRVTIGSNGFLYMNSHGENTKNALIRTVCNVDKPNPLSNIVESIQAYFNYFKTLKIHASLAIIPTKSRIYPENLPNLERHWCQNLNNTWIDTLISKLNDLQAVYPIKEFTEWKKDFPVYLPHRFHWEGQTPYEFSKLMLEHWDMDIISLPNIENENIPSDLGNHLSGLHFQDTVKQYTYPAIEKTCKSSKCINDFKQYYSNGVAFNGQTNFVSKHTLLILSDSFGAGVDKHFLSSFSQVVSVNLNYIKKAEERNFIKWIVDEVKPSQVLYLMHDGGLVSQSYRLKRMFEKQ